MAPASTSMEMCDHRSDNSLRVFYQGSFLFLDWEPVLLTIHLLYIEGSATCNLPVDVENIVYHPVICRYHNLIMCALLLDIHRLIYRSCSHVIR